MPSNLRPANGRRPTRLAPFPEESKGHKAQSNACNAAGKPRAKACISCLKGIGQMNAKFEPGRGAKTKLEVFSCLVATGYGNGGVYCARCIGLNQSCEDPPAEFKDKISLFLGSLVDYNKAAKKAVADRTGDEQTAIEHSIAQAQTLAREMENTVKAANKKAIAGGSPMKGMSAGMMFGADQPATRGDLLRVENLLKNLGDMAEYTAKQSYDSARIARSNRLRLIRLEDAWNRTAAKRRPAAEVDLTEEGEEGVAGGEKPAAWVQELEGTDDLEADTDDEGVDPEDPDDVAARPPKRIKL